MDFRLLGEIGEIETIAANLSIRERNSLKVRFGGRRWRSLRAWRWYGSRTVKSIAPNYTGERYWYEAHGVDRRKMKVKRILDLKAMVTSKKLIEFAVCLANKGYDDLEV
jgi:hypothetical protein